jgi:hypothetical protein
MNKHQKIQVRKMMKCEKYEEEYKELFHLVIKSDDIDLSHSSLSFNIIASRKVIEFTEILK